MSITTLPDRGKYDELKGLAKEEVKKSFALAFDKGERYLETFIDGSTQWTVERTKVFNELVNAQFELQKALKRESTTEVEA